MKVQARDRSHPAPCLVLALLVALAAAAFSPAPAQAEPDWKELRASGALGERYDGLLVARDSSAEPIARRVNAERLELYSKRARELGVSVEEVGKIFFKENFPSLRDGTWILTPEKTWIQKQSGAGIRPSPVIANGR